jgi:hypothetical protein
MMTNRLDAKRVIRNLGRRTLIPVALFLLLSTMASWPTPAWADRWITECVDCPKYFVDLTDHSLRLDAAGHPHLAYGGERLCYAWHDGTSWHYETVDDSPDAGGQASLELDEDGFAHISYQDELRDAVKYAYQDASGWHVETVDAWLDDADTPIALALSRSGQPQIAYYGNDHGDVGIVHAFKNADGWQIEFAADPWMHLEDISLAIDGRGYPHLSYCMIEGDYLGYAFKDAAGWHDGYTNGMLDWVAYVSLAIDQYRYPHIIYAASDQVQYAYKDASGWRFEPVAGAVSSKPSGARPEAESCRKYPSGSPSLVLDKDDHPHVSFYDSTSDEARYAYNSGSGWQVMMASTKGGPPSPVVDGDGRAHIGYLSISTSELRYMHQVAYAWHDEVVDSTGQVGAYSSLVLDAHGRLHISYQDVYQYRLKYAYRDEAGWHLSTVPTGSERCVTGYISLKLDGDGYPHISYSSASFNSRYVDYVYQDASGWHTETAGAGQATYTSLDLDQDGHPHISYGTYDGLKYAYKDGSGWHSEIVDDYAWFTSLVLDANGYPHIGYSVYNGLGYAHKDDSGWHIEIVDGYGGAYVSLALDDDGDPHLSSSRANHDLGYTYKDMDGWRTQAIDDRAYYTSLALDKDGYPHIGYTHRDPINYCDSLKYAYQDDWGWHILTVYTVRYWYDEDVSLVLDEDGRPYIAYYAWADRDL